MSRDVPEPPPTNPGRPASCEACSLPATFRYRWPTHSRDTLVCDQHMQSVASHAAVRLLGVEPIDSAVRLEASLVDGEETWRVVR